MGLLIERLRRVRQEVLGLNRRNQEFLARFNPPHLVALVDHKLQTKRVLAQHGLPVPETFGHYLRNRELSALAREAEARGEFVLKPARGAGGEGVLVVVGRRQDRFLKPSGAAIGMRDILAQAADIIGGAFSLSQSRDEALLEHRLAPEPILAAYSPGGIPDVRVLVVHGVPLMAMLRLPTRASDGRANLHVGGVGVGVSLATGEATHAIWRDRPALLHPDTQRPLSAIRVPHWDDIRLLAARTFDAVPLGYMGIDVVVDEKLGPMILELNARPGLSIQLANHRGLRGLLTELAKRQPASLDAGARCELGVEIAERREALGQPPQTRS